MNPSASVSPGAGWMPKLANCGTVLRRCLSNHRDARLSTLVKELRRHRDAVPATECRFQGG